jgi:glycosyltransferase involved in cell wall biosynthesis
MNQQPKISVVTVCYNAVSSLEKTILSVLNQTYSNVEYIVIDGGSKDGTVDIIKNYKDRLAYWISEPDDGIYDAMNKGIKVATGDYINFMNSDDWFTEADSLKRFIMSMATSEDIDIFYGDTYSMFGTGRRFCPAESLKNIKYRLTFSHQAAFIKLPLMKERMYNLKYKLAADYDFFLKAYIDHLKFQYIPQCVATVRLDQGASFVYFSKSKQEVFKIHVNYFNTPLYSKLFYFKTIIRFQFVHLIKALIPKRILNRILRIK